MKCKDREFSAAAAKLRAWAGRRSRNALDAKLKMMNRDIMHFNPALRKLFLTLHLTSSLSWLGAVLCFLVLSIAGLCAGDQVARSAYIAMGLLAWLVILPLSFASPLTGAVQSCGTHWGLLRYRWVVAKIVITLPATAILLVHMRPINTLAHTAANSFELLPSLRPIRVQLIADAGAAMLALLAVSSISVFKPGGMTAYGRRKLAQSEAVSSHTRMQHSLISAPSRSVNKNVWVYVWWLLLILALALFVGLHLSGGGMGQHFSR